jgi:lipoprotein signal peptidase
LLGYIFGSRQNAPYYIAAVAILSSLAILGYIIVNQPQNSTGMTLLGAIVIGGLGYIFGKSSS